MGTALLLSSHTDTLAPLSPFLLLSPTATHAASLQGL